MTNIAKSLAALVITICALLLPSLAQAQAQINLTGNYLTSAESGTSLSDGLWGGGVTFRYFITPKVAVGLNGRYFTLNQSTNFGGASFKASVNALFVTAQGEYFFTESALRPYAGIEAGLYRGTAEVDAPGFEFSFTSNNFGVAPKVGLQYAITPTIGVNIDAGYHIVFAEGDAGGTLLLGAGVFYTFGQR